MRPLRLRLCKLQATTWFPDWPADALGDSSRLGCWKRCVMQIPVSCWEFSVLSYFQHSPFTPQIAPNAAESVQLAHPYALIK